jgi:hypothetical protein
LARFLKYALFLALSAMMFAACRDFSLNSFLQGDALATVGDKKLYIEDVPFLFTDEMTPRDSLKLLNSYVDQWVKQQLKMEHAEITSSEEQERIDRMVDDYRQSLLIYGYEKKYIDSRLDTTITPQEVSEYYASHVDEFRLASPLVKGLIVRFPTGFRQENQMRIMASTGKKERLQDLIDICIKNNFDYREFPDWTDLSEITAVLPRLTTQETARMLTALPPYELTQGGYRYFLVITDVLRAGSPAPAERVAATIRTMVIIRRKQQLLRQLEDSLFSRALILKEITIHVDTVSTTNTLNE